MKKTSLAIAGAVAFAGALYATTVIPPSFDELVSQAQMIFQGTVSATHSEWVGEGAQRHIRSLVTFKVEDALKGKPGDQITLEMMGGTVGGETMEVTDAPKFKVGDRDVLFVENNGTQFIPLVGIMHGRFRIQKDSAGRDAVYTNDGAPLTIPEQVGKNAQAATSGRAISVQEFKQTIRAHGTGGLQP